MAVGPGAGLLPPERWRALAAGDPFGRWESPTPSRWQGSSDLHRYSISLEFSKPQLIPRPGELARPAKPLAMQKILLLFLLLLTPGWSEAWSHQGTTWKHSNGISITFPAEFQVEADGEGLLSAAGKQGFVTYKILGLKGENGFKGWRKGQLQSFESEGLKVKAEFERKLNHGMQAKFIETEYTSQQGIVFVVLAAAVYKGSDYIGMTHMYPKEREKDWTPLFQGVVNSIKR